MPTLGTSVVLCTFNGAAYLEAQVESLFAQDRKPDEIVAVDDASIDGTHALLVDLAGRSPVPMEVHRNESRLGHVANFERALTLARRDVVFLCDQDDIWLPGKIAAVMSAFEDRRAMLVHSDAILVDADLRPLGGTLFAALGLSAWERGREDDGHAYEVLLTRSIVTGATAAIRRSVFERAAPFPPDWLHDEWLAVAASLMGCVVRIDRPLIAYRQHAGNQIGAGPRGIRQVLKVVFTTGTDYQRRRLRRLERLRVRLPQLAGTTASGAFELIDRTIAHATARASLPAARWRRVPTVLRETLSRRYFLYSRGWTSVMRDLLGPIVPE